MPTQRTPRRSWADLQLDAISSCNDAAIDCTELAMRMLDRRNKTWVDLPLLEDCVAACHEAAERVLNLLPRPTEEAPILLPVGGVLIAPQSEVEELREKIDRYEEDARREFAFHTALEQRLEAAGAEWYGTVDGVFWRIAGQSGTAPDWRGAFLAVLDALLSDRDS